ncbi:MAG: winged helix DNA-binding domain-containing protein [Acidimicrobiales bacterium]|nr:winged helix DNA-binding domain-containing protein [Acidimicrobiales bacterium]HRW37222.1 crosslink repair DNA glycosylase YcaQ family protein [Aquihabitans sp.]
MPRTTPSPAAAVDRARILAFRWARHQLDRSPGSADASTLDVDLLDAGVQDTGPDGSAWALALRGLDPTPETSERLALAWTLRGAPHAYRRADLGAIAVATAPWGEADAAKRIFDASKPLRAADIDVLDALRTLADLLRDLAARPIVKGDASGRLNALLPDPFLRDCRPCKARHIYELPFRLATLQAGLELRAGTSPPVLERVPGLVPNRLTHLADDADPRVDVIRCALRFWGPATPKEVAALLDVPAKDVRARWPEDAVEVAIEDAEGRAGASVLAEDLEALVEAGGAPAPGELRLLGPYDPYLQGRDRDVLVADPDRRRALWPVLGRPGAIAVDGRVVGLWRPRTAKGALTLRVEEWDDLGGHREALDEQGERLARHRDGTYAGCVPMDAT